MSEDGTLAPTVNRVIEALDLEHNDPVTVWHAILIVQANILSQLDEADRKQWAKNFEQAIPAVLSDANRLAAKRAADTH